MVSDAGGKKGFVYRNRQSVYKALVREGKPKAVAAAIANGGHTAAQRSRSAKKAAMTRRKMK